MQNFDYTQLLERPPVIEEIFLNDPEISLKKLDVLRLDIIHKIVSGNKIFKLRDYLADCIRSGHKMLLTFGGAYSNHLAATAFAAKQLSLKSIGLVRGELMNNPTLRFCREMGMELHPVNREYFREISELTVNDSLAREFGDHTLIPMGGFGPKGAQGASDIMNWIPLNTYSHICVSVGSATTLAGMMLRNRKEKILAFPAIKNMQDIPRRLSEMGVAELSRLKITGDYHFGGFARWNDELIEFMNKFYKKFFIPLDIVYTSKMMYGVCDMLSKNNFLQDDSVLCIHTGGLQGNQSLPKGILTC